MLCKLSGVGTVQKTLQCFHSARQIRLHNRKKKHHLDTWTFAMFFYTVSYCTLVHNALQGIPIGLMRVHAT